MKDTHVFDRHLTAGTRTDIETILLHDGHLALAMEKHSDTCSWCHRCHVRILVDEKHQSQPYIDVSVGLPTGGRA